MSTDMMDRKVKELRELKRMQEELAAEIEAIQDELEGHLEVGYLLQAGHHDPEIGNT